MLLTRPPLGSSPKGISSLDLHVLGTPPAFVLSQDQTLNKKFNLCSNYFCTLSLYFKTKRIAGLLIYYSVQFSKTISSSLTSDFIILSFIFFLVNNFFQNCFLFFRSHLSATRLILTSYINLVFIIHIHLYKLFYSFSFFLYFFKFF